MHQIIHERAKKLRRNMSIAEQAMWQMLRKRQLKRYRFRRQYMIYPYIADFICLSKKFIIELDGEQHEMNKEYDDRRTKYLTSKGYRVYRISNQAFFSSDDELMDKIVRV